MTDIPATPDPAPSNLREQWDALIAKAVVGDILDRDVIQRMNGIFDEAEAAIASPDPSTGLNLTSVSNALDEAWLESNDSRYLPRPPDLAPELLEALKHYIAIEAEPVATPAQPSGALPHPECVEAYHGELIRTGRTIMSVARVQADVAAAEAVRALREALVKAHRLLHSSEICHAALHDQIEKAL